MLENAVKENIKQGRPSMGLISNLTSPHLTEIFGLLGFDFIIFDMEHSAASDETVEELVRAAKLNGIVPMARVRENSRGNILRVLDAGCLGVMVPHVETREDAKAAINYTRYSPSGRRGFNWRTVAAQWGSHDPSAYLSAANENILTILQIETEKGYQNAEEIASVEGIDAIVAGPSDLSVSMGYPANTIHEDVLRAISRIREIAGKAGIASAGALSPDRRYMVEALKSGDLLFIGNPAAIIAESFGKLLQSAKAAFLD
ncbi:MAG: HpcH/HpaI aldolase family protein [bacterium]